MRNQKQDPRKPGNKTFRYSFRMNEAQHIRFQAMLTEAECQQNISRFILSRIFG